MGKFSQNIPGKKWVNGRSTVAVESFCCLLLKAFRLVLLEVETFVLEP